MSEQIKLCPFCPKEISEEFPPKVASELECGTPNFSVHAPCCDFYGPMRGTADRAIKAWNHRAIPAEQILVPREALESVLNCFGEGKQISQSKVMHAVDQLRTLLHH